MAERPDPIEALLLDRKRRRRLWAQVASAIEDHLEGVEKRPVSRPPNPQKLAAFLRRLRFDRPVEPEEAVARVVHGLTRHQVHTSHPAYFGLFNPASTAMGIAADALVAAFNPQLASWSHSPLAVAIEQHLLRSFAARFGYDFASAEGTFTSGGAEANHTALAVALSERVPGFREDGLAGYASRPVVYVTSESHHSVAKAARLSGLGSRGVREVPLDASCRMDPAQLARMVQDDRAAGHAPLMVVATAGTTAAGMIDPLDAIATVAAGERLWLHVDAAWGGAAALVPHLAGALAGIARADSIAVDAHKWLSVPMGAGMFLTRHPDAMDRAFRIATGYMPKMACPEGLVDPYAHSMQWSRRFIGLKLYLSLAVAGWDGYASALAHQARMADRLRLELADRGFTIVNDTPLPLVCFVDATGKCEPGPLADRVVAGGRAWLSAARFADRAVLRACITSYRTRPRDIQVLVDELERARSSLALPRRRTSYGPMR